MKTKLPTFAHTTIFIVMLVTTYSFPVGAQTIKFKNISKEAQVRGYKEGLYYVYGHGVAIADISGDSLPDIYVSNAMRDKTLPELLYISVAGGPYLEQASERGVDDEYGTTGTHGIVFVDIDNDGDYDIFNGTTDERNRLYQNQGNGFFNDITVEAGLANKRLGTRGVVAFDANNDGFLDLFAVNWNKDFLKDQNEFYINKGDGTFEKTGGGVTSINENGIGVQGVTAIDVDNDGDMDLYISRRPYPDKSKTARNQLLINDGTGRFAEGAYERGISDGGRHGNGTTFADYDNDGDLDAFVVSTRRDWRNAAPYLGLFRNRGDGTFDDLTEEIKIRQDGYSALVFDVDNDGDLDYFALRKEPDEICALYLNDGSGHFSAASETGLEIFTRDARGAGVADIDNDGDLDLYFACKNMEDEQPSRSGHNYLFRNDTQSNNRWLKVFVRGPRGDLGGFGTKIWLFDSGHLHDMNHLIGFKQVTNAYGYLCQDDPIQHFGLGQRDNCDVKIQMLDGTRMALGQVPADRKITFSKPNQIVKSSGDGQKGAPSTTLPQSLVVTLQNSFGEVTPGVKVVFEVTAGGGSIAPQDSIYSDLNGQATVRLTLGPQSGQNIVRVTCPDMQIPAVEFTAETVGAVPVELRRVAGNNQSGAVALPLPDSIKVQLLDDQGLGVENYQVIFTVIDGGGTLNASKDSVINTSSNDRGYAAVNWRLGTKAGRPQTLQVSVLYRGDHINGSPMMFHATALPGPPATMSLDSGDGQSAAVGTVLPDKLIIRIADEWENGTPDHSVTYEVIAGGGLVDGGHLAVVQTDQSGQASVSWQLGTKAGEQQIVRVTSPAFPDTVLTFSAYAVAGPAASMSTVGAIEFTAMVGSQLDDSLVVFIGDEFGNAVVGFDVHFSITQGNGSIGSIVYDTTTDTSGLAWCWLTAGTKSGQNSDIVEASAIGLDGSPITFYISTLPEHPKYLTTVSGDRQTGFINERLSAPFVVAVTDSFGNGVAGHQVLFKIIEGHGVFDDASEFSTETDSIGEASAFLTLGPTPEDNTVEVSSGWQGRDLEGSPQSFSASSRNRPIDASLSTIFATSPVIADGNSVSEITVTLKNELAEPIRSVDVTLGATGTGNTLIQPQEPTDENGKTTGQLSSTNLGLKKIWAMVNDTLAVNDSAKAFFISGGAFQIGLVSGNDQRVMIGHRTPEPVVVSITDSIGHPIEHYPVKFVATQGGGAPTLPATVATDGEGIAAFHDWILGSQPGTNQLEARAEGLHGSPIVFRAEGVLGTPTAISVVSGNNQSGLINSILPEALIVSVIDVDDSGLYGIPVHFEIIEGLGQFLSPTVDTTDTSGLAEALFQLGPDTGKVVVAAWTEGLADSAIFTCNARNPRPTTVAVVAGQNQIGRANEQLDNPLEVEVKDETGEPMSDINVYFSVISGGGQIVESQPVITNEMGTVQSHWILGNDGLQQVIATVGSIADTAWFTAQISANQAPILYVPSDTAGQEMELLSFYIKADDPEGDSLILGAFDLPAGASFNSATALFFWQPAYDQAGDYRVGFFAEDIFGATSSDTTTIHILNSNRVPVITSTQPPDTLIAGTYGIPIVFSVTATDEDGDPLTLLWQVNHATVAQQQSFTLIPNPTLPSPSEVSVLVTDTYDTTSFTWTLDITSDLVSSNTTPSDYELMQNFPNPFNNHTTIGFTVPTRQHVSINIFNTSGQIIFQVVNGTFNPGQHLVTWCGIDEYGQPATSGIYYYQMICEDFTQTRKLLYLR